jgi:hypothetical protein
VHDPLHLRVALPLLVLRRPGCVNDGWAHDRAGRDADAVARQWMVHRIQHRSVQLLLLKKVTELADGRLVRRRSPANCRSGSRSGVP